MDVPSKKAAYYLFVDFMKEKGFDAKSEILSRQAFMKLWNAEFEHCKTSKRKEIYFKCQVCEDLKVCITDRLIGKTSHRSQQ